MELRIDLESLKKSCLSLPEYISLYLINEEINPKSLEWGFIGNSSISDIILLNLEQFLWIKSTEDGYVLREKGRELFKNSSIEPLVDQVINYYKLKTDSPKVSNKAESNRKPIRGRLQEGYSVEDLNSVVDIKTKQWKGTSMDMYLRIETLFGAAKFQGYIREAGRSKPSIHTMV